MDEKKAKAAVASLKMTTSGEARVRKIAGACVGLLTLIGAGRGYMSTEGFATGIAVGVGVYGTGMMNL